MCMIDKEVEKIQMKILGSLSCAQNWGLVTTVHQEPKFLETSVFHDAFSGTLFLLKYKKWFPPIIGPYEFPKKSSFNTFVPFWYSNFMQNKPKYRLDLGIHFLIKTSNER